MLLVDEVEEALLVELLLEVELLVDEVELLLVVVELLLVELGPPPLPVLLEVRSLVVPAPPEPGRTGSSPAAQCVTSGISIPAASHTIHVVCRRSRAAILPRAARSGRDDDCRTAASPTATRNESCAASSSPLGSSQRVARRHSIYAPKVAVTARASRGQPRLRRAGE